MKMGGCREVGLPRVQARCAVDIKIAKDLTEFVRVKLMRDGDQIAATPTGSQGSAILSSISRADGLLIGPASESLLKKGAQATVLLLGGTETLGADAGGAVTEDTLFEGRRQSH